MFETIVALCVVLGAIVLLRTLIVRLGILTGGRPQTGRIQIIETTSLGMKQQLHLVEVDGQAILLGACESGIQRLARLPAQEHSVARGGETEEEARSDDSVIRQLKSVAGSSGSGRRTHPRVLSVLSAWLGPASVLLAALVLFAAPTAMAQSAVTDPSAPVTFTISIDGATAPDQLSDTMKIVLILTAISIAPSILLMATCFTRILIVLALLRQAIGTATLPPNQVLVGLALMTTVYVMTPVGEVIYADSLAPYMAEEIGGDEAIERGIAPVREYLLDHTREEDLLLFVEMKGGEAPTEAEEVTLPVLMPAYMISEIRTAFEIGFMIYLPFLVVDLVIASMLISLGMIMLPPVMISLPFKLMLFVLVDGWNLTLTALVSGLQ